MSALDSVSEKELICICFVYTLSVPTHHFVDSGSCDIFFLIRVAVLWFHRENSTQLKPIIKSKYCNIKSMVPSKCPEDSAVQFDLN